MAAEINQDTIDGWRDHLDDFEDAYVVIFAPRGISRDAALIVWALNQMKNVLDEDLERVHDRLDTR